MSSIRAQGESQVANMVKQTVPYVFLLLGAFSLTPVLGLYNLWIDNWVDVAKPVTLNVNANVTGALKIGQVVEFRCTAVNHSSSVANLEWKQVFDLGDSVSKEYKEQAGHSELIWVKTITAADHGSQVYCVTGFIAGTNGRIVFVRSKYITLNVEGVTSSVQGAERVYVSVRPTVSSQKIGDVMEYVCNVANLGWQWPSINIMLVKDNIEKTVYTGYHTGYRWMKHNLTSTDRGTSVYCRAWIIDDRRRSCVINSEHFALNIL